MIRFAIQFAGLVLALMLPLAGAQTAGSIEGNVVVLGSSTPVPRAQVLLRTAGGRDLYVVTTALDGRFAMSNVAPGEYRVYALRDGFLLDLGSPVTVVANRKSDISIGMVPESAISGRVVDWDGLPVVGIKVYAVTYMSDDRGRRVLLPTRAGETDDLGEYRIYWVQPGVYFVRADPADYGTRTTALPVFRVPGELPTRESQQLISTYFPNALDAAGAGSINLRPGETFTGADIRLTEMRKHRVSGSVSVSTGRAGTELRLTPQNPASGLSDETTDADQMGSFEFENVIPGSYILTATGTGAAGVKMFGRVPIDVGNKDVENLSIALAPGFDLRIRMTIEGRLRRSDDPQLVVNLKPAVPDTPFPTVERNGDEEFTMRHFMPGDYSVAVLSLGARSTNRLYLKSAQFGGLDVLTAGLHIDGPPSSILDIVMADGAGTLSGTVLDDERKPVPGVTVVLVPEPRLRGRSDLYKTAMTDTSGKFEVSGITPGQYKAFSWEAINQGAWQVPEFLDAYEDRGHSVRIDGAKSDPITIQLIPTR